MRQYTQFITSDVACFSRLAVALRLSHGVVVPQARPLVQRVDGIYQVVDSFLAATLTQAAARACRFLQIAASLSPERGQEVDGSDFSELEEMLEHRSADLQGLLSVINTNSDQLQALHRQLLHMADHGRLVALTAQRNLIQARIAAMQGELVISHAQQRENEEKIVALERDVHFIGLSRDRSQH